MTIRTRLRRLEGTARQAARAEAEDARWPTDEHWLARYEGMGREGYFAAEPDFLEALAAYGEAVRRAQAGHNPPWEPWPSFLPGLADRPNLRRWYWRDRDQFPELTDARLWLIELDFRVAFGAPPVGAAEWRALGQWFEANAERMERQALPAPYFDLGAGRLISSANVRHDLARGFRACGAGRLAQDLRRLKELYGEGRS